MRQIKYRHDNGKYYSKREDEKSSVPISFNTLLLFVLALMVLFLIGGTAVAIVKNGGAIQSQYRKADPTPEKIVSSSLKTSNKLSAYTEVGQIRAITRSTEKTPGTLLIVNPWFSYPANDIQLFEELAQKDRKEKSIIIGFFSEYTKAELLGMGEHQVKEEIKNRINKELVLGKIQDVYFNQYIFFE